MTALSLRRLWAMYKRLLAEDGFGKRDLVLAHAAFYAGARSTLKVLNHLLEQGDDEKLHPVIQHHGRQIKTLQGLRLEQRH
jgi:hypothetical protein